MSRSHHISGIASPDAPAGAQIAPDEAARRVRLFLGCLIVFVMGASFLAAGQQFLNDPDTLWHITVGGDIWRTKSFPHVDAYSHTFTGEPWIAKEWLSQLALFGVYSAAGWNGVALFALALMLVVIAQVYWGLSELMKPTYAAAAAAAIIAFASTVFVARPHVVVMPVVIWFVYSLWRSAHRDEPPRLILLAAMCLWSNLHGSFTFGYVAAAGAFALYLNEHRRFRSLATWRWIGFLALLPVMSIIHPYGIEAVASTIIVAKSEALPYIGEWKPFIAPDYPLAEAALLALVFVLATSRLRLDIVTALFVCFLAHLYLTHIRFVYLFFLLAPYLIAFCAAKSFPALSAAEWVKSFGADAAENRMAAIARPGVAIMAALCVCAFALAGHVMHLRPQQTYPIAAIDAARAHGVTGNVLNSYNYGGALIFERIPTYVDGRADRLFQGGFFREDEKLKLVGGEDALKALTAKYNLGWSIYPVNDAHLAALDRAPDWARIYEDDIAVVHARQPTSE
ncbi:MAG: hypothetical protein R3C58_09600 [Parvularculaceae bacterium]